MKDMNDTHDIERKIEAAHAPLSADARARMWSHIESQIAKKHAVLSPYVFMSHITHMRALVPATLALIVIVGLGGTALASESARPGDALFPIDRAIETVRLSVARDDATRVALTHTFTDERFAELKALIDDGSLTDATTRTERIDEAVAVTLALIDEAGVADDARIAHLANELRNANVEVRDDRIRARWDDEHIEVRHDDDDDERIEYRGEDGERIRIEEKDGEVRVKSSSGDESDDEGSDSSEDDSHNNSNDDSDVDSDTSSESGSDDDTEVRDDSDNRDEDSSGNGSGKDSEDDSDEDSSGSGSSGSGKGSDDD